MQELLRPTNQIIDAYLEKFNNSERYFLADKAIEKLFEKFPHNEKLEDVILKISVINDLYSTNIFGTFSVAKHILNLQVDSRIQDGDPTLVNEIAIGHSLLKSNGTGDRNFYSFATKYCSWHNREAYPIYDSFVEKVILAYQKADNFSSFSAVDLKSFPKFKSIVNDFKKFYGLTKHGLKEIDKFIWIYGKETFPKKNKIVKRNTQLVDLALEHSIYND